MRKEEIDKAIKHIRSYRKYDEYLCTIMPKDSETYANSSRNIKYWDMAIKALEQEAGPDKSKKSKPSTEFNEVDEFNAGLEFAQIAYRTLLLTEKPVLKYIFKSDNILRIITNFTASEIYNAIQNLGLSVGDEVMRVNDPMHGITFVITRIDNEKIEGISRDNCKCLLELDIKEAVIKTGRHFDNIHEYT